MIDKLNEKTNNDGNKIRHLNRYAIVFIIIGVVLFLGNIALLITLRTFPQEQSAWLTFVSGWLGFFATLIIGIIAYKQNNKINFLSRKQQAVFKISTLIDDFNHEFYKIDYRKIISIKKFFYKKYDDTKIGNLTRSLNIYDKTIDILLLIEPMKALLMKIGCCSNNVISFYETLVKLETILDIIDINKLENKNNRKEINSNLSKQISEWYYEMYKVGATLLISLQSMKLDYLQTKNFNELLQKEAAQEKEETDLSNYFNNINKKLKDEFSKEQNDGQVEHED